IVIEASDSANLTYGGTSDGQIALSSDALAPGIYQYSYLIRLVAAGRYAVPPPVARADGTSGVGNSVTLDVAGR
ncbi:MAG TPA: hypothetical protein VFU22_18330, partial [Roseiflexaceae bacterium]|nr:hypothetical protein [Roseiflexaceae bacterium]